MKYIFFVLMLFVVLGCSKDDVEPKIISTVSSITPLKAKMGDTITITGSSLDELKEIIFKRNENKHLYHSTKVEAYKFLSRSNEKITLEIPELRHEDITIVVPGVHDFTLEVVGFIPLDNIFNKIDYIQVLNHETAYILSENRIYKLTDGFYKWELVYRTSINQRITSFYYLDENHCWIGISDEHPDGNGIYFSSNGGADFSLKFLIDKAHYSKPIKKLEFLSLTKGFFVNSDHEMFVVDNDSFENIFTYYPELSLPFGEFEIYDFNAINEELIFLAANAIPALMKFNNQDVSYSNLQPVHPPMFFDNVGYTATSDDIYKSTDLGDSWSPIGKFPEHTTKIEFLNSQEGLAFLELEQGEVHSTNDGGTTWKKIFTLPFNQDTHHTAFTGNNGLMGSSNGRLWKYRQE